MIIVRLSGGMGNQMFQYALGRALSLKHDTALGLDTHDLLDRSSRVGRFTFRNYDLDVFNVQAEILPQSRIPFRYRAWGTGTVAAYLRMIRRKFFPGKGREISFNFNQNVLDLGPDVYLDGYWQSYKYFESVAETIRRDFTLSRPLLDGAQKLQQEISSCESVAVHIRRGDYVGNAFHSILSKEYYDQALRTMSEKTPIERLYVFSDDIEWCKENLSFDFPTTFVGPKHAGEKGEGHMMLMSSCKHLIIANSSFSWWAAWLCANPDKVVVAPKGWFGVESVDIQDLLPPGWLKV